MTILGFFLSSPKQITYAEQHLKDPTRALGTYGVKDGDVVVLRQTDRPLSTQPAFPGEMFDGFIPAYWVLFGCLGLSQLLNYKNTRRAQPSAKQFTLPHTMTSAYSIVYFYRQE